MTRKNAAQKRAVRALSRTHGMPYTAARRARLDRTAPRLDTAPAFESVPSRSLDTLSTARIGAWCAQQVGDSVTDLVWPDLDSELSSLIDVDLDAPTIHELTPHTTWSDLIEEFDGGTLMSTVTATAELTVEGLMDRGAAAGAAGELVDLLDGAWNNHYSSVLARQSLEVELGFTASANPDYEQLVDFEFVSATVIGRWR